jgi:hypothetical protein
MTWGGRGDGRGTVRGRGNATTAATTPQRSDLHEQPPTMIGSRSRCPVAAPENPPQEDLMPPLLAATTTVVVLAAAYAALCAVRPYAACRRCSGTGSVPRMLGSARACRRCRGRGIRLRIGTRIVAVAVRRYRAIRAIERRRAAR